MVERRVCTFCGSEIEPGTGRMYVKKDGVVYNFCTSKCYKNMIILGRVPRRTTWTRYFEREKEIRMKGGPEAVEQQPKKARKIKKAEAAPAAAEEKAPVAAVEEKEKEEEKPAPKAEEKKETAKEKKAPAKKGEKPAAPKKERPAPKEGGKE